MTFTSTSAEAVGSELKVKGNLTIRGVTKPVVLDVEYNGAAKDPWATNASASQPRQPSIDATLAFSGTQRSKLAASW